MTEQGLTSQHIGYIGMGFTGQITPPTVWKHWRKIDPIRSTTPRSQWYNNYATHKIHRNKSTHSEMGPGWQNLIQRTVRTAHLSVLMTVHSFSTQYKTEQFW